MILSWLAPALAFLKRVPWPVYAALAVLFAAWLYGNHRAAQERAEIAAELEAARAEAVERSLEAASKADLEEAKQADKEAAILADLTDKIETAEAEGSNPLDELF